MPEQAKDVVTEPKRDEALPEIKKRPAGFLADDKISHDSEQFDYIKELHTWLWAFVQAALNPGVGGDLATVLPKALKAALQAQRGVVTEDVERVAKECEQGARDVLAGTIWPAKIAERELWVAEILRSQAREIERLKSGKE